MTTARSNDTIDAKLATFVLNRDALKNLAHEIAMDVLYYAAPKDISDECGGTGDCSRILALAEVLPNSWEPLLAKWLKEFVPIRYNKSGQNYGYDKAYKNLSWEHDGDAKRAAWNLEGASQTTMFDLNKEPEVKAFDFIAMRNMIERLPSQLQKKIDDKLVPAEDLASVEAMISRLKTIDVRRVKAPANSNDETVVDTPAAAKSKGKAKAA